jgi:phosphatidylethanolamine/phosphatidyl-N-methylethanolamine N-methyltransferase
VSAETPPPRPAPPAYDRVAAHYDRAMRPLERWVFGRRRAQVLGALPRGARLLEVGAGTGANFPFYPRGARGAATDASGEMLLRAREKAGRPEGVRLLRASAERLPFADGAFDAACAALVFCSVASPPRAFAELRRVVRPGGTVALLEHVRPRNPLGYLFDALNLLTVPLLEDHFNRRTADEARRAGLRLTRVESHLLGVVQLIVCRVD